MPSAKGSQILCIALVVSWAFSLAGSSPARAAEADETLRTRRLSSRQVIGRIERPEAERESWIVRHLSIDQGRGLQVRQTWSVGDRRYEFRVRGPVVKAKRSKKLFGLQFELRF